MGSGRLLKNTFCPKLRASIVHSTKFLALKSFAVIFCHLLLVLPTPYCVSFWKVRVSGGSGSPCFQPSGLAASSYSGIIWCRLFALGGRTWNSSEGSSSSSHQAAAYHVAADFSAASSAGVLMRYFSSSLPLLLILNSASTPCISPLRFTSSS